MKTGKRMALKDITKDKTQLQITINQLSLRISSDLSKQKQIHQSLCSEIYSLQQLTQPNKNKQSLTISKDNPLQKTQKQGSSLKQHIQLSNQEIKQKQPKSTKTKTRNLKKQAMSYGFASVPNQLSKLPYRFHIH